MWALSRIMHTCGRTRFILQRYEKKSNYTRCFPYFNKNLPCCRLLFFDNIGPPLATLGKNTYLCSSNGKRAQNADAFVCLFLTGPKCNIYEKDS